MKKLVCNLYSFGELSEDAKHNVCENDRQRDYNWGYICQESDASERVATLDAFCKVFGIKYRLDYDHCHRFITWRFEDSDIYDEGISGKYLLRFLNKFYYQIRKRKYFGKLVPHEKDEDHPAGCEHVFRHSRITWEEQTCPFTGMCYDCDILDKIFEWYKKPDWKITLRDLFEEVFSHYLKLWSDEDDYRMTDESIGDMIQANWEDKLYFEDGTEFLGDYDQATNYIEEVA